MSEFDGTWQQKWEQSKRQIEMVSELRSIRHLLFWIWVTLILILIAVR